MTNKKRLGRPPIDLALKKIPIGLKLPRWLIAWLDTRAESRAIIIEEALCAKHNLKSPEK